MMHKRSIILYWLLLLLPTVLIGAAAFQLLRHEQERIDQEARLSAQERAQTIGDTLQVTVGTVEDELTEALRRIQTDVLAETLTTWEAHNPLVRNAFIWSPKSGVLFPQPGQSATLEERRFISRYSALLSGRIPWQRAERESRSVAPAAAVLSKQKDPSLETDDIKEPSTFVQEIRKFKSGRQSLVQMAQGDVSAYRSAAEDTDKASPEQAGWIPWFAENSLYILGWVQQRPDGLVYGVELEVMTLLSRLIAVFPSPAAVPKGLVYALMDGGGRILHQAGETELESSIRPDLTISLAPYLPHWQVAVYFADGSLLIGSGKGFIILAGLLLAIFIVAIVLGGSLLMWQAHRNMKDAQQKTSFVSNVSHELKTPLTSIRMYAELLAEGRIKKPEKKMDYLQVIVAESQRLTRLVNNVLDFSRLEQRRKKYHLEVLDVVKFLYEILEAHKLRLRKAGLELMKDIPDQAIIVHTDRDALEQVVLNLVDNALKYASRGKELLIRLAVQNGFCELQVMDRGPGVPSDHRSKIFEKFHRIDDSLTTPKPGSGLGLSIARRLMRDLGGDLVYRSRAKGGSCFVVLIPCHTGHITQR
jgi:signal transduction histidine kinase